jgi:uncharacterized membrane protein
MSQLDYTRSSRSRLDRNYARTRHSSALRANHRVPTRSRNVGNAERIVSLAAGSILTGLGMSRKSVPGLLIAGIGGGLLFRGATGHCGVYEKLGLDTTHRHGQQRRRGPHPARYGIHVVESILINKPAKELYDLWRNLENLPRIMSHLKTVRVLDERRSQWEVDAPRLFGGAVKWDAELIRDEPHTRIAWRSLPGSQIDQRGMVTFLPAAGERGVLVRVDVEYRPPAGQIGHWVATLLGDDPAQQIHDDLRNLKRTLEIGEVITINGQPRGKCIGARDDRR